jgi:hypothetical protein
MCGSRPSHSPPCSSSRWSRKTFYEVETTVSSHTRDLLYDATGKLVEVEEEVANDAVPAAAMKALMARGKVSKVESVVKTNAGKP